MNYVHVPPLELATEANMETSKTIFSPLRATLTLKGTASVAAMHLNLFHSAAQCQYCHRVLPGLVIAAVDWSEIGMQFAIPYQIDRCTRFAKNIYKYQCAKLGNLLSLHSASQIMTCNNDVPDRQVVDCGTCVSTIISHQSIQ